MRPGGKSSEPWWNQDSRKRSERGSKGAMQPHDATSASSGPVDELAVPATASGETPLGVDAQALVEREAAVARCAAR